MSKEGNKTCLILGGVNVMMDSAKGTWNDNRVICFDRVDMTDRSLKINKYVYLYTWFVTVATKKVHHVYYKFSTLVQISSFRSICLQKQNAQYVLKNFQDFTIKESCFPFFNNINTEGCIHHRGLLQSPLFVYLQASACEQKFCKWKFY